MARPFKFTSEEIDNLFKKWVNEYLPTQYYTKADVIKSGERAGEQINIKIEKPPTVQGFCLFIDCDKTTFYNILNADSNNIDNELINSITRVHDYIQDYQVGGAINNMFNPMLVARINGINEQININNNIQVNALPTHIANNVIDLTDFDYKVLE